MANLDSNPISGNVDTIILKILSNGDRYGYDILNEIKNKSGGELIIKQPTLYSCLKRLESQGFVSSRWDDSQNGGRRKYYTLTDMGKDVFMRYNSEWERSRSLIDNLMNEDEPPLPVILRKTDDYVSDFEENYVVGKRPAKRKVANKNNNSQAKPEIQEVLKTQEVQQDINESDNKPEENTTATPVLEVAPIVHSVTSEELENIESEENKEYNNSVEGMLSTNKQIEQNMPPIVNPRELLKQLYNQSSTNAAESYLDAVYTPPEIVTNKPKNTSDAEIYNGDLANSKQEPPPVKKEPEMPKTSQPEFIPPVNKPQSIIDREYRKIIGTLVKTPLKNAATDCEPPTNASVETFEETASTAENTARDNENIADDELTYRDYPTRESPDIDDTQEIANEITTRNYNNSAKEYSKTYYYKCNQLMFKQYLIICLAMFICGAICMVATYMNGIRMPYDYVVYLIVGLFPILLFLVVTLNYISLPNKIKRLSFNFKTSLLVRVVIMLQCIVIVYCIALICKMPVGFSIDYLPLLLAPSIYTAFIPISAIVYNSLIKSGKYSAD